MATKSVQRSLKKLREDGWTGHVVERYNPFAHKRQDFGGFADILAYKSGETGVLAIQACSDNGGDVSAHTHKLLPLETVRTWVLSHNRLEIWGWGLRGERGKRKVWTLRVIPITIESLATAALGNELPNIRPS